MLRMCSREGTCFFIVDPVTIISDGYLIMAQWSLKDANNCKNVILNV